MKFNIEEIIQILGVLSGNATSWNVIHTYNDERTNISFKWEEQSIGFRFEIGEYNKLLKFPQSEFMKLLLNHILKEKIEFATGGTEKKD